MFIVHIHLNSKPGTCFWVSAPDGSLTRDVFLAHEFSDFNSVNTSLIALAETPEASGGAQAIVESIVLAEVPESVYRVVARASAKEGPRRAPAS